MNLIPIVYTSLLIVSELLVLVLTVSYILSKLKRNTQKPYEFATANGTYNQHVNPNYKRAIVLTDNNSNIINTNSVYRATESIKQEYYKEEKPVYETGNKNKNGYISRYSRVHTNTFDFDDNNNFNSYYRRKPIQYNENNIYKYYSEV